MKHKKIMSFPSVLYEFACGYESSLCSIALKCFKFREVGGITQHTVGSLQIRGKVRERVMVKEQPELSEKVSTHSFTLSG